MIEIYNIYFLQPVYFFLLPLFLLITYYFIYNREKGWIDFAYIWDVKNVFGNNKWRYIKNTLLVIVLLHFIIIMANPNILLPKDAWNKNGIDIVLVLDISNSMRASDLYPTRLEVAKKVLIDFIQEMENNRLGFVIFAWKPFTSIPLTFDYNILTQTIGWLTTNHINQELWGLWWTAIWDAVLISQTLFQKTKDISQAEYEKREKVIILLTDGDANIWINPILAARWAQKEWIKIYTIWIGSLKWWAIYEQVWPFEKQINIPPLNDRILKEISQITSAEYFRADNNASFSTVFHELSMLEKNNINIDISQKYNPKYNYLVFSLFLFLLLYSFLLLYNRELRKK